MDLEQSARKKKITWKLFSNSLFLPQTGASHYL